MQSFHSTDYQHFLAELRATREAVGITQAQLAERLGLHQTMISKAERGVRRVDVVELRVWMSALGVSLSGFVTAFEARLTRHSQFPVPRTPAPRR